MTSNNLISENDATIYFKMGEASNLSHRRRRGRAECRADGAPIGIVQAASLDAQPALHVVRQRLFARANAVQPPSEMGERDRRRKELTQVTRVCCAHVALPFKRKIMEDTFYSLCHPLSPDIFLCIFDMFCQPVG